MEDELCIRCILKIVIKILKMLQMNNLRRVIFKSVAITAIALCVCISTHAQQGEKALGINLLSGFHANDIRSVGLGAKFLYNVTNPIRLAGELDFSKCVKNSYNYGLQDLSVYLHYIIPVRDQMIYPVVGIGNFKIKMNNKSISSSISKTVFTLGLGTERALTNNLVLNAELRYKSHGGNHIIAAVGLAYKF